MDATKTRPAQGQLHGRYMSRGVMVDGAIDATGPLVVPLEWRGWVVP
jgi:hypothetical protein